MKNVNKYTRQIFNPPHSSINWVKKDHIEKAPIWCSVDLRDGNQALMIPMSLEEKLDFFKLLVKIGFKEIEVGFPASNETEYQFLRTLIEKNLIPDDVTVQVLTQSREHIIRKTFESLKGCKNAVVHIYNSTSVAQREQVFKKPKDEIIEIAVKGAKLCKELEKEYGDNFRYEYSPESFTGTEPEFALEICNAVLDVLQPTADRKAIINLPATVEMASPHVYANQVEYICENLKYRENVVVSLHPHNDRGCAVADSELGLLAGADRIEGTLFGNGERTGNVDIITLAMNMFSHGVDPKLDFSNIPEIAEVYERVTRMHIYERSPYSGKLVFAAFSGSHQDAIAKGMKYREDNNCEFWTVPYLPIDPTDVGRVYETDVIRINSQSGKGGIGWLLENKYGYNLPPKMRETVSYLIKDISDHKHDELSPHQVHQAFKDNFVNVNEFADCTNVVFTREGTTFTATMTIVVNGSEKIIAASGNGRLDAVGNALKKELGMEFSNLTYTEHALERGSASKAVAYVSITDEEGAVHWGAGVHNDIIYATINALFSAINRVIKSKK